VGGRVYERMGEGRVCSFDTDGILGAGRCGVRCFGGRGGIGGMEGG